MTPIEQKIRTLLGVPEDAQRVFVLGMDAHMDWDWRYTFQDLLEGTGGDGDTAAKDIIQQAWALMIENSKETAPYFYSVCEMAFLRAALALDPSLVTQFQQNNLVRQLAIEGGGITSPDNLLTHGEAFLRNYLAGWAWQSAKLDLAKPAVFAYMPDDFGHDAQLPVMLEALGFPAVCISRIPGSWDSSQKQPLHGGDSLWTEMIVNNQGADFFWVASDGSSVLTHLEQHGYQQGNSLAGYCNEQPFNDPASAVGELKGFWDQNEPSSPTPYIYLPCGNDFAPPIPCLLAMANAWNQSQYPSPGPLGGTWAACGTLTQYIQLVQAWGGSNPGLISRPFDPTPYWTGFYASRPQNKILHHATVRALLGAEVFGRIASLLQSADAMAWAPVQAAVRQGIEQGWEALLPSTHHDYITGTAVDSVYTEEQVPLLAAARSVATGTRRTAVEQIAGLIGAQPQQGEIPVAVFNQLGFGRSGLVEMPAPPGITAQSVRSASGATGPVQITGRGTLVFTASAPSLGYEAFYLSSQPVIGGGAGVEVSSDGASATLSSSSLRIILSKDLGWAITSLQPIVDGAAQPSLVPAGQVANALAFYEDKGNIYDFGNEFFQQGAESYFQKITPTLIPGPLRIVESGPLRIRVEAEVQAEVATGDVPATYLVEYSLVDGEPFVRMAVTGAVPLPADPQEGGTPYAVMVRFPFASGGQAAPVDGVLRGTPYHWHDLLPVPYWSGPTFQATHHFVVPSRLVPDAGAVTLGALYHSDVPAWAIDEEGAMIGCILRNTPGASPWPDAPVGRGAAGSDFGTHRREYALRIPQGLGLPPSSLAIFQESFALATPLLGTMINVPSDGVSPQYPVDVSFPASFSLVEVTSGNAFLTVAKAGQFDPEALILRLYQPSNASQTVTLSFESYLQAIGVSSLQVQPVTALEQPVAGATPLTVTADGNITLTMDRALLTLAVTTGSGK